MKEQAQRIQTSILNAAEKKVLVWLAERQPRWMTSDKLTFIGVLGAIIVAVGYALSNIDINWL
ncbi:MAG: CDP-alcohol phosphatidyltransferase, partial [Candidatus Cryptobacteroides sp.]